MSSLGPDMSALPTAKICSSSPLSCYNIYKLNFLTFFSKNKKELKATSKNVIPAKAGIQNLLTSLDSRLRGSDKLVIIRGSLK